MATKLVAVKLTPTEAQALSQLVTNGHYKSASAALRQGLIALLVEHKISTDALIKMRLERCKHPMRRGQTAMNSGRRRHHY